MSSTLGGGRFNCLIVLPSCKEGVSSQSFIQCFTLTHSAFTVQIATPGGKNPEFLTEDEQSRKWLNEFRTKAYAVPLSLEIIDANRYSCLLIPHAPGAAIDLANNSDLGEILMHFIKEKKLVCAIGMGVTALLSAKNPKTDFWGFKGYAVTGSSVLELSRWPDFTELPIVAEDALKDAGGAYSASSEPNCVHVQVDGTTGKDSLNRGGRGMLRSTQGHWMEVASDVIYFQDPISERAKNLDVSLPITPRVDRHLVTGQNQASTFTAVQNLVLLSNQRQAKMNK